MLLRVRLRCFPQHTWLTIYDTVRMRQLLPGTARTIAYTSPWAVMRQVPPDLSTSIAASIR